MVGKPPLILKQPQLMSIISHQSSLRGLSLSCLIFDVPKTSSIIKSQGKATSEK